jgi:hypothetical protein
MIGKKDRFSYIDLLSIVRLAKITVRKNATAAYLKVDLHITHGEVCPEFLCLFQHSIAKGFVVVDWMIWVASVCVLIPNNIRSWKTIDDLGVGCECDISVENIAKSTS